MIDRINISEILNCLPHRHPFMLLDRVLAATPGEALTAIKNVTYNEPFFAGHFPGHPVMPGVLIIEALAQACGVLAYLTNQQLGEANNALFLLAGIDNARFRRVVEPGDQLTLHVKIIKAKRGVAKFSCVASVAEQVACVADMVSAQKGER